MSLTSYTSYAPPNCTQIVMSSWLAHSYATDRLTAPHCHEQLAGPLGGEA